LSRIRELLRERGRTLKALVLFGSYVYDLLRSRDIDLLVVVDRLDDAKEKASLELEIVRILKRYVKDRPLDVVILDVESFRENLKLGALASGLIAGFEPIYDEIGVNSMIEELLRETSRGGERVVIVKRGRRLDLSSLAKAKLKVLESEGRIIRNNNKHNISNNNIYDLPP
jgi:predicted nucleotidyltransferase